MEFERPNAVERNFNRVFGWLVRLGIGLPHNFVLEVRGRKSGRIYATPVNVLTVRGVRYLVAPRGDTQWARNAAASGEVALVRAMRRRTVKLRPIADTAKPEILKAYLDQYSTTVQRYFPVKSGSPIEAFTPLASRYPVFEIVE